MRHNRIWLKYMKTKWIFRIISYLIEFCCFIIIYSVISSISSHGCVHENSMIAVSLTLIGALFIVGYWLQRKMAVLYSMVLMVLFIIELIKADVFCTWY